METIAVSPFPSIARDAGVNAVVARFGGAAPTIMAVFAEAMEQRSELSPGLREVIAAYTSALNDCQFCECSHAHAALAHGMDAGLVRAIRAKDLSKLNDRHRPIFQFARSIALTPTEVEREHIEAIVDAGWSEQTAFDVLFVVSAFAMINKAASTAGLYLSEEVGAQVGAFIATKGYLRTAKAVSASSPDALLRDGEAG